MGDGVMNDVKCMNEYLLVRLEKQENAGVYLGEDKSFPKKAEILAFSDECKNKNFIVGKTIMLNKYEMIPYDRENDIFFVSEKAVLGMF
jgi:hypothetical protein